MPGDLLLALRHNTWATRTLIDVCRGLSDEQLEATAPGTFGTVIRTLRHIVGNEPWLMSFVTGADPTEGARIRGAGLEEIDAFAAEMLGRWEELLAGGFDPDREVEWVDDVTGERKRGPAGMFTTLTTYHGSEHRAQVCTVLTTLGVEPPELDVWVYAEAAGLIVTLAGPPPTS